MSLPPNLRAVLLILLLGSLLPSLLCGQEVATETDPQVEVEQPVRSIWTDGIGSGFAKGARSFEIKLTRGFGAQRGGSDLHHDLWLGQLLFGSILNDTWGAGHWYGGNLEWTGQFIGGVQDFPEPAYFLALDTGLRYHFSNLGRVVPFLSVNFGVSATDIGEPDLGGVFQFNEQLGGGLRYFLSERRALTVEYYFQHISNGSTSRPNHGADDHMISVGYAWLF